MEKLLQGNFVPIFECLIKYLDGESLYNLLKIFRCGSTFKHVTRGCKRIRKELIEYQTWQNLKLSRYVVKENGIELPGEFCFLLCYMLQKRSICTAEMKGRRFMSDFKRFELTDDGDFFYFFTGDQTGYRKVEIVIYKRQYFTGR